MRTTRKLVNVLSGPGPMNHGLIAFNGSGTWPRGQCIAARAAKARIKPWKLNTIEDLFWRLIDHICYEIVRSTPEAPAPWHQLNWNRKP